jgi:hypothetical protein
MKDQSEKIIDKEMEALILNKIQKLVYVTLGEVVIQRLADELAVVVTAEELTLSLTTITGKSLEELAELDLTYELIKSLYQKTEEYKSHPKVLAIVKLPKSVIPDDVPRALFEQQVKHKGEVWVIHKNDADPHPSSPHAHNYDANLKLHLGNGDLYAHTTRVGNIGKKALCVIRQKIIGIDLPAFEVS